MEMKHAGSRSELLEFFINQPESSMSFYLSPLDLAQMAVCCRWLHQTVQSNRSFVRKCLYSFLGPCMTAIRIFRYSLLGLETVDDYLYFLDDSIARNEVLKQFVFSIQAGKVFDEELVSQIPANWIEAISSKFQCDDNIFNATPFENFPQFYEELGLNGQFDKNELLCLNCEDQLCLVTDQLETSRSKPFKSKKYGYFTQFLLDYGFATILQLEPELNIDTIQDYCNVLGPLYRGSLRDFLLQRIELTTWCREIFLVAEFLVEMEYLDIEQCQQLVVDKLVRIILDDTSALKWRFETFYTSAISDDDIDCGVLGLNEDACELFHFVPCQLFSMSVLPAFEKLLPSKLCASMLTWITIEYGIFSDGENALYRMIARKLSSNSLLDQSIAENVVKMIAWCRNWKDFEIVPISQSLCTDIVAARKLCKQILSGYFCEEFDSDSHLGMATAMSLLVEILGKEQCEMLYQCLQFLAENYFSAFWDEQEQDFEDLESLRGVPSLAKCYLLARGVHSAEVSICKVAQYILNDLMKHAELGEVAIEQYIDAICETVDDDQVFHPRFPSMLLKHLQSIEYPGIELLSIKLLKLYGSHGVNNYFYSQFVDEIANLNLVTDLIKAEMRRLGEINVDRVKAED
ncbi:hypothetical protein MP228_004880 [Amoeboaphelidium protococcarum]|nr:hypothetical protein MP228_004880 [Amoeboaphelidium protococcarum]